MSIINDMSLPASKCVRITDPESGISIEIPQQRTRMKYYALSQLQKAEPETYKLIKKIEKCLLTP